MNWIQIIILRLIYLTPFGYILKALSLQQKSKDSGVYVQLNQYLPMRAEVKKNPTINERLNWFVNGVAMLVQGYFVILKEIGGDLGGTYAIIAIIFGGVNLISAIFPKISWNKNLLRK